MATREFTDDGCGGVEVVEADGARGLGEGYGAVGKGGFGEGGGLG